MIMTIPINNTIMNSVTYVLYSEEVDYCVLIDCGEYETLKPVLDKIGKAVKAVLLTHGHSDHIMGLSELLVDYPEVEVFSNESGHEQLSDSHLNMSYYQEIPFTVKGYHPRSLSEGMVLKFENLAEVEVLETPGHNPSCLSYKVGKDLFTGDAYIPGLKVFTKLPKGNREQALASRNKLIELEKQGCIIHCGHHSYHI